MAGAAPLLRPFASPQGRAVPARSSGAEGPRPSPPHLSSSLSPHGPPQHGRRRKRGGVSARTLFDQAPAVPFRFRGAAGAEAGEVPRARVRGCWRRDGAPFGAASALLFPPQARRRHVAATGVAGRAGRRGGVCVAV